MSKFIQFLELFINILFNFLATLMHEIAHALVAILTMSKILSISVTPQIKFMDGYISIVYGSVRAIPRFLGLNVFVALAPFLLFIPLYYILNTADILDMGYKGGSFIFELDVYKFLKLPILEEYFIVQLFLGAFPSSTDYRVALRSAFSKGFFMLLVVSLGVLIWL